MNSRSSRSEMKFSCPCSSLRRMCESLITIVRAFAGLVRIRDEIEFSVLNRKCGLIWLARASNLDFTTSTSCSASFISKRVLFQIFNVMPTQLSVVTKISKIITGSDDSSRNSQFVGKLWSARKNIASATRQLESKTNCQTTFRDWTRERNDWKMFITTKGEKVQISSLRGGRLRRRPLARPSIAANGSARHSR